MNLTAIKTGSCLHLATALLFVFLCGSYSLKAQDSFNYFPEGIEYNENFPKPADLLGYEVGEWHASHDQLVAYMKEIARLSDRVTVQETGRTYENRPLLMLTITSPKNQERIEEIKQEHALLSKPGKKLAGNIEDIPVVVWLGNSVHGNEASAGNSALLTAYHWAAAKGEQIDQILDNTVILLDPCLNPDGFQRFATWVNMHKGNNISPDPLDREHNEVWPGGRTNHYWFDLNRDWLPAQHPESQARLAIYHQWYPNIVTDHHEMGANSTFFFQPGIPSRNNPLIPSNTVKLTKSIAKYHARELDRIGSLYYSEESFDDFYFGKGSTYPDITGSVGILFEQASSRGHVQNSVNGPLTFQFGIRNQFTTAWSTVLAAYDLKNELLTHQQNFYASALKDAENDPLKAYVWNAGKDHSKERVFVEMLNRHEIEVFKLAKNQTISGREFKAGNSYVVPLKQANYRLVKAMFGVQTTFRDSLFYDVSAWTLPLSLNLNYASINGRLRLKEYLGAPVKELAHKEVNFGASPYAYALRWDDFHAPKLLNKILAAGLQAKVATKGFSSQGTAFDRGTILIPVKGQTMEGDALYSFLKESAVDSEIAFHPIVSGYTSGVNLGSGSFKSLRDPKVAILTERGVSGYEAGEVWHLLDYRMDMTVSLLPKSRFGWADLSRYNTIIMVDGSYSDIDEEKLADWVRKGGLLIATRRAGKWLADKRMSRAKFKTSEKVDMLSQLSYADEPRHNGAKVIGGAIFKTKGDLTHPLLYGIENEEIPVFRRGALFMEQADGIASNPLNYTSSPLLAGYIYPDKLDELSNTSALHVSSLGRGRIVTFADNPNFRAFWLGTNKIFLNAVFFGQVISASSTR